MRESNNRGDVKNNAERNNAPADFDTKIERIASHHSTVIFDTTSEWKATDQAWITGVVGAIAILGFGAWAGLTHALENGLQFFHWKIAAEKHTTTFFFLILTALIMSVTEFLLRFRREGKSLFARPADAANPRLFVEALAAWVIEIGIFGAAIALYHSANEYGFLKKAGYYQPWFRALDLLFDLYIKLGFFYHLFTRYFQQNREADAKAPAYLALKLILFLLERAGFRSLAQRILLFDFAEREGLTKGSRIAFHRSDQTAALALLVKLFFIPLMTVFFSDQFFHLQNNMNFIVERLGEASERNWKLFSVRDVFNISFSVIFAIDVGIAWVGYLVASRWLKNHYTSVEPTMLGWVVAAISYPPLNNFFGWYYSAPSEHQFFSIQNNFVVSLLAMLSILSFFVYMSATVVFGMRFSNLTHRGIIRTGAYRYIRHPAYASKNFSWWVLMFPYTLYEIFGRGNHGAWTQIAGLVLMTTIYYWRAVTEERHLMADTAYRDYMKKVRYRFIPGFW